MFVSEIQINNSEKSLQEICALSATNSDFQLAAAKAWTNWEMATSYLVVNEDSINRGNNERFALVNLLSSTGGLGFRLLGFLF